MKLNFNYKKSLLGIAVATLVLIAGCTPDEVTGGNPLTEADIDAGYSTVTTKDTVINFKNAQNFVFKAASDDSRIQYHLWRASDKTGTYLGQSSTVKGGITQKFTFTESGTYKIEHRVVGRVGGTNFISEQTFNVVIPPTAVVDGPNLIKSPNFETPSDWTVLHINSSGASWAFSNGAATISGTSGHQAIYQAVTVEAGRQYEFDMNVSGPGSTNTWFEVYVSRTAPTEGSDYNADGKRMQLNTWAGCATSAFDGLLSDEQCGEADVSGNIVTFAQSGTVYFLIKCGSGDGNINSIAVKNVTFHTID
ncbi:hypothetical protein [Flavobacterium psychrotrophum]|uniref:hypothetical protein n=1 Tax=Flavobacterium psychrotrophum TaxID=2294119 RepID=UPI000E30F3E1|nr:hypothetical protein [Flavobacterium psychrotrophum]